MSCWCMSNNAYRRLFVLILSAPASEVGNDALGFSVLSIRAAICAISLPLTCAHRFSLPKGGKTPV